MVKIKHTSRDFNKVEQYLMTLNPGIVSLKDVADGTSIPVSGYMIFDDEKEDGKVDEIMSIITPDNKVYSCQSATFKRSLQDISFIMGDESFAVIKTSGVTKGKRDFINCELDIDWYNSQLIK